jgi:hypothetical protein
VEIFGEMELGYRAHHPHHDSFYRVLEFRPPSAVAGFPTVYMQLAPRVDL